MSMLYLVQYQVLPNSFVLFHCIQILFAPECTQLLHVLRFFSVLNMSVYSMQLLSRARTFKT
jgi:hypothetical protein